MKRQQCSVPVPGDRVFVGDQEHLLTEFGLVPITRAERRPSLAERLVDAIFCPACLCLRIHPTHLLVCPEHRRKVIHRARER